MWQEMASCSPWPPDRERLAGATLKGLRMYLVIGATGNVGGPVARQLFHQGADVRALVRDSARADLPAGVELAVGDLDDCDSVSKAVQGVDAIFLMHVAGGTEQTKTMIAAARDAGAPRIVL